MLTIFRRG